MRINLKAVLQNTNSSHVSTDQKAKATHFVVKEEKRCIHGMRHRRVRERWKKAENNTTPKEGDMHVKGPFHGRYQCFVIRNTELT